MKRMKYWRSIPNSALRRRNDAEQEKKVRDPQRNGPKLRSKAPDTESNWPNVAENQGSTDFFPRIARTSRGKDKSKAAQGREKARDRSLDRGELDRSVRVCSKQTAVDQHFGRDGEVEVDGSGNAVL
jgi:hypothetical protein